MKCRDILLIGVLVVCGEVPGHAATILISDLFSGTNGSATSVTASAIVLLGDSETLTIGPGYTGTVTLPAGVIYQLALAVNASNSGALTLTGTGLVGVGGTFTATKTFTDLGTKLAANTTYELQITGSSEAALSLLSSLNFTVSEGTTSIASTISGLGVGGSAVSLLGLSTGGTITLDFTTPSVVDQSAPLTFSLSGATVAGLLGSTLTLSNISLSQVPEPPGTALLGLGLGAAGVAGLLRRRLCLSPQV